MYKRTICQYLILDERAGCDEVKASIFHIAFYTRD